MGQQAVADFAREQVSELERRYLPVVGKGDLPARVQALAEALNADGYAASARPAPVIGAVHGEQICQHHCPVAHVAAEFPQLCEAETEAFGRLLGTPVQRLATIAHGDGVCTTHVTCTSGRQSGGRGAHAGDASARGTVTREPGHRDAGITTLRSPEGSPYDDHRE
jgi:predicted ArsR family transcriptional regulator